MSGMDVDQIFVSGGKTQSTDEKINLSLDELVQQNRSNSKRKSNQKIRTTIREQGARRQQKFDNQRGLKANKPAGKAIIRNRANQILKNAIKRKQRGTSNGDVTPRRNRQNNNNNNDGNNNNNNNKNNKNISPKKIFTKMGNRLNLQAKNRPSRPRTRAGEGWFEDRQGSNKNNGGVKINKPTDIKITVNNDRSNNKSNTVASRRSRGNDNNRNGNNRNDNNSNNNNNGNNNNNNNGNNNNNRNSRNGLTRQGLRISGGVQKRQGFVSDRLRNNKKNIRVRDNNNDNRNNNDNNNNNNNSNNNNSNANKSSGNSARRRVVREPGTTSNSNSSSSTPSSTAPKTLSDRFAELRRKKNNNNNNSNNNAGNSKRRIIRRQ